ILWQKAPAEPPGTGASRKKKTASQPRNRGQPLTGDNAMLDHKRWMICAPRHEWRVMHEHSKRVPCEEISLLPLFLLNLPRCFRSAEPPLNLGAAAVEGFGDSLAVFRRLQAALVARIADEGNLRQNRRHVCPDQHNKRRFLYAAIPQARILRGQSAVQR